MANEIISTNFADLSQLVIASAKVAAAPLTDLKDICLVQDVGESQRAAVFNILGSTSAAVALTEGNSLSNIAYTNTAVTLTPAINAAWPISVTRQAQFNNPDQMIQNAAIAARKIVNKRNTDIVTIGQTFTTDTGDATKAISETAIVKAVEYVKDAGNGSGEMFMVIPTRVWRDIVLWFGAGTNILPTDMRQQAYVQAEINRIFGLNVVVANNCFTATNSVHKVFVTDRLGIGYANSWDMYPMIQEDALFVGTRASLTSSYAVGKLDDKCGAIISCLCS